MQVLLIFAIALTAVFITLTFRNKRDREMVEAKVAERGGKLRSLRRVRRKKHHPFPDTGRGWWAWRVEWDGPEGPRTSYVLTTREGLKEWKD